MMRSLMISFFVITLVTAVFITNQMNAAHYGATDRFLFGYRNNLLDNTYNGWFGSSGRFSSYDETNINGSMSTYTNPTEQPNIVSSALDYVDAALKTLGFLRVLFDVILYSTVGFGAFINLIFQPVLGFALLPWYINYPVSTLICFNHLLAVMQFMRGFNIEN